MTAEATSNHSESAETLTRGEKRQTFAAFGVQAPWLDSAHGQTVRVRLLDGKVLSGVLVNHDTYCLALQQPGNSSATLIFKHAVAYVLAGEDRSQPQPG
jgi:sRNA-binding regulator protein Hfq